MEGEWAMLAGLELIGTSPDTRELARHVDDVDNLGARLLITGEDGTAKTSVARLIHERSSRHRLPFTVICCDGASDALLESQLIRPAREGFPGAGTVLLDHIDHASRRVQDRLIGCFDVWARESTKPGARLYTDVTIIASANDDLAEAIEQDRFREHLYCSFPCRIRIPSLRHRAEDILPLTDSLIVRHAARVGTDAPRLMPSARMTLQRYEWRGNTHELMNVVAFLVERFAGRDVEDRHLPGPMLDRPRRADEMRRPTPAGLYAQMIEGGGSFWDVVYERFIAGEINRFDVSELLARGMKETRCNLKRLLPLWNMPVSDKKYFLNFIRDARTYRSLGDRTSMRRPPPPAARNHARSRIDPMLVRAASFPAERPAPTFVRSVIEVFTDLAGSLTAEDVPDEGLASDDIFDLVKPTLRQLGFTADERLNGRVEVPLADSEEDCSEDGDNYVEIHFIDAYHRGWGCGLDVADINQGHWVTPYSVIAYEPSEVLELDHLIVIVPDRSPVEHRSPPVSPTSTDFALLGSELGLLGDELPFGITVIGLTFLAR